LDSVFVPPPESPPLEPEPELSALGEGDPDGAPPEAPEVPDPPEPPEESGDDGFDEE
jgi:hypothetical protein